MAQHSCNYCQEDIIDVRVACVDCKDFDLCIQCFACGVESGNHKRNHRYQLINKSNFPIFGSSSTWEAVEELALLDAVEHYGFGNWEDISEQVNTKTPEEVEEHYCDMYIFGNIGKVTWPAEVKITPKDHTQSEEGPLSPDISSTSPLLELPQEDQQLLGYLPHRDDFEREYDNEAESQVSSLAINLDDEDVDIELKLAQTTIYSRKLTERYRRKRISRAHGLINMFLSSSKKEKSQNEKKKISKEEKEFQEKLKAFAQFHTGQEHQQLYENMRKEKQLKTRIKELCRYRRNGIISLSECSDFDSARYKREKKKENKNVKKKSANVGSSHRKSLTSKKEEKLSGDSHQENKNHDMSEDSVDNKVDITTLPGYELLSEKERKLCSTLPLKPSYYITFKATLLKDYLKRKQGVSTKTPFPEGLDKNERRIIINFFTRCGWISGY